MIPLQLILRIVAGIHTDDGLDAMEELHGRLYNDSRVLTNLDVAEIGRALDRQRRKLRTMAAASDFMRRQNR